MGKRSVGIYISAKYVDIAELSGSLNAPRLLNFIREEIPAPPAEESKEDEQRKQELARDSVTSAIRAGLYKLKVKPAGVYTVLASTDVMIRYFSMPQLPKSERPQAVRFEARKYIPFKIDEIVCDFKILPPPKQRETMQVFFIATAKEQLNSHLEIFSNADTQAVGVDIVLFALVRMLLLEKKIQARESTAVLYIDNDKQSASIHVIDNGMPFLSRDFKISMDDKEAFFEKAASELRVSLGYYRRMNPQAEVAKIVICGEYLFVGLDAFIADELKIITETLEQLQIVKSAKKPPPSSVIAVGTALAGLGGSPYSVNLSPIAVRIRKKKLLYILLTEAIAAVFIVLATSQLSSFRLKNVLAEFNGVKEKGVGLPEQTSNWEIEALNSLKEKKIDEIKFLWLLLNNRISWTEKLDRVGKDIPDGVWIQSLTIQESLIEDTGQEKGRYPYGLEYNISISGRSFSLISDKELDYITQFFTSLKEDPVFMHHFGDINLGSVEKKEAGNYWVTSFRIHTAAAEGLTSKEERRWWHER